MSIKKIILFLLISCSAFSQSFGDFASAVKINSTIYNTTASAQIHQIDPNGNALWLEGSNLGNFGELTTCSSITGAEIKTFKNINANVCSATLFWRVYPASGSPSGAFNSVPLTTISECNLSASPVVFYDNLGPCSSRDQKWKNYAISINFTQGLLVGNYIFEVYYSFTGSDTNSGTCETIKYISNGGNNFKANFSIVKPTTAPTASQPSFCEGDTLTLNANVSNGIAPHTYSWTGPNGFVSNAASPVISNITLAQAGSYSVVITDSCGSTSIIQSTPNVTVIAKTTPSFTFGTTLAICSGDSVPVLPTTSSNSYSGSWNPPAIDTTQNGVYSFTSNSGQCATNTLLTVTLNSNITPTFLSPAPICSGTTAPDLPLTSLNGITGTWSPTVVDNTQTGNYLFTPDAGQCADTTTLSVTVYQDCSFGSFASAVWLTNCADNNFFNTVGSGSSIIGPSQNIFPNTDFGTYLSNSGTFKLRGAEVKTFKNALANVCSARLHYRIYPQSGTPVAFTVLNLPFYEDCNSGSFPSGGPCNAGDQKWQKVLNNVQSPVDLTAFPAGDYVIEVYYDVIGDVNSTSQCDDTILIDNNGANFIATYTLQNPPGYFGTDPSNCNGNDGSILITNLAPNTTFLLTYEDDGTPVNAAIVSDLNGEYVIDGLNAGDYNNIYVYANACLIASGSYSLFNPVTIPTFNPIGPICAGATSVTLPTLSNEGISGTWSPALNNLATTTYTFTPNSTINSSTNLIVNGDFSQGNSGFSTDYQYLVNAGTSGVQKAYGIVSVANSWFQFFQPCMSNAPSAGNMMVVDGSTSNAGADKVWGQTVTVEPNKTYTFSYWLQTIATPNQAIIEVKINGVSIGTATAPDTNCQSSLYTYTWNSGSNTSAQIAIFDKIFVANGNDFSLDDISLVENNSQCATSTTLTITVNQPIAATFNPIQSLCSGGIAPTLPPTSLEGFTGTWSPTIVDNTQTLTYNFIPTAGQCALPGSVMITVTPNVTPTFSLGTSVTSCAGFSPQVLLPTTSIEGITGAWNPSTLDYSIVGITVYTFTPNVNQCATNATLTATVTANVSPIFSAVPFQSICSGASLNTLPTTSNEGIIGTWSPALNNTQTTTYTFTPNNGQCAIQTTQTITVNPIITPTFTTLAPLCIGENVSPLPATSNEGITGTWSPSTIDNTQTLTYQFTPTNGQCATNGTTIVTVQSGFDFEISAGCIDNNFVLEVIPVNGTFDGSTANYDWYTDAGQAIGSALNTFNVTEYLNATPTTETLPITFNVTVTTPNGCTRNEPITLTKVFCGIQKGISANNDGLNDFFDLQLLNVNHLEIFNRYGMTVYSKSNYTNEWIGQSDKGDELPDGTYYYVIEFNGNQSTKTGWIYINRKQ